MPKPIKGLKPVADAVKGGGSPMDPGINTAGAGADKNHPKLKGLQPNSRGAAGVKGGSKIMANAHEMKKSLISNFPR